MDGMDGRKVEEWWTGRMEGNGMEWKEMDEVKRTLARIAEAAWTSWRRGMKHVMNFVTVTSCVIQIMLVLLRPDRCIG